MMLTMYAERRTERFNADLLPLVESHPCVEAVYAKAAFWPYHAGRQPDEHMPHMFTPDGRKIYAVKTEQWFECPPVLVLFEIDSKNHEIVLHAVAFREAESDC